MTSGGLVETAFYNRTYDEALEMTVEARGYVADVLIADRRYFDCEALRLTTRLSQMMAWLMVQRAVHAVEIAIP